VSLHDDRLGQMLEALCAAQFQRVCGAIALHALDLSASSTPWLPALSTWSSLCQELRR
jgi:hypothetical protein